MAKVAQTIAKKGQVAGGYPLAGWTPDGSPILKQVVKSKKFTADQIRRTVRSLSGTNAAKS